MKLITLTASILLTLTTIAQSRQSTITALSEITDSSLTTEYLTGINTSSLTALTSEEYDNLFTQNGVPVIEFIDGANYSTYLLGKKTYGSNTAAFLLVDDKAQQGVTNKYIELVLFSNDYNSFTNSTVCKLHESNIIESTYSGNELAISEGELNGTTKTIHGTNDYIVSGGVLEMN